MTSATADEMWSAYGAYERRAVTYAAEIASVVPPRLLQGLLHTGMTVAEMPSGTGHYLRAYAAANVRAILVDSSPAMLSTAQPVVRGQALSKVCAPIQELQPNRIGPIGLVVIPNGALNQLAAGPDLQGVLAGIRRVLAPGGLLLAQLVDDAGGCGFYDSHMPDGLWRVDRRLRGRNGEELLRMRCQHHHGAQRDMVRIDLTMIAPAHGVLYDHRVQFRLLNADTLCKQMAAAALEVVHTLPGNFEFLTEVLIRPAGQAR